MIPAAPRLRHGSSPSRATAGSTCCAKSAAQSPKTWAGGPEAEPDQHEVVALQQEVAQLGEALSALPDKQKDLIERAYFGDLSHSEIAQMTDLPPRHDQIPYPDGAGPPAPCDEAEPMTMTKTINHHLTPALLQAYSAGALPEAMSLAVATHLSKSRPAGQHGSRGRCRDGKL